MFKIAIRKGSVKKTKDPLLSKCLAVLESIRKSVVSDDDSNTVVKLNDLAKHVSVLKTHPPEEAEFRALMKLGAKLAAERRPTAKQMLRKDMLEQIKACKRIVKK